jgi:type IV pilus assembly protein PilQ
VRALEEVTDVVVVANPKIVALNKQEAEVIVGRRDGYLTTTVTETATVQTVEFLETGTQIKFRPVINEDGAVRLSVHPKDSNGGLTAANLPFEETTEAHADILVDDGHTVLIGGLFRERTLSSSSQLPVLGNIPVLGLLFGSRSDQTIREEVIILLTVHIIKETDAESAAYEELLEDVERIRVGSRRGLLGSGRERLAQAYYHEALKQMERGNTGLALLNVRMTLNNQPKHLPAMKMREQILDNRLWDDEGTRMRTFVWELIQTERAQPHDSPSVYGRPQRRRAAHPPSDGSVTP